MLSLVNDYQRPYANQRAATHMRSYSCVIYIDQPSRYSIVDSKRLTNVDENGRGFIKELNKSYKIRVEQTGNRPLLSLHYSILMFFLNQGTLQSMEKYALLLEKVMQSQMHDEVPSDCEEWQKTQMKQKNNCSSPSLSSDDRSPTIADRSRKHLFFIPNIIIFVSV